MAGNTDNPRVWLGADVFVADLGAELPDDLTTPWDTITGWEVMGLLSEDGMTQPYSEDESDLWAWGPGGILVRTINQHYKTSFTVSALEDNPVCFELRHPGSTAETVGDVTTRIVTPPRYVEKTVGFELIDGDVVRRLVIQKATVKQDGDVTLGPDALEMFPFRFTPLAVFNDDISDYELYREITNNPAAVVTGS